MSTNQGPLPSTSPGTLLTTEAFASAICCEPASIRKRYCTTGSYFGVQPRKLPNRRLLWPANAVDLLLNSEQPAS